MMRMKIVLFGLVMGLAVAPAAMAADSPSTVAVVGQADAQPLQELIEAELTMALSEHAGMVIVDRSRIDDLLAEQEWSTAQLVHQPLKGGRMIGAQFIVYLAHESSPGGHRVSLIAVETESGNVIGERAWRLAAGPDPDTRPLVQDAVRLIRAGVAEAQTQRTRPPATVLSVIDRSDSQRLRFLEESLRGVLEDRLDEAGWRVLHRRHAGKLAKETTLNTTGLVRPDAEVIAGAARLVIRAEFKEQPAANFPFKQTPITFTLMLRDGGQKKQHQFTFMLDTLSQFREQLSQIVPVADRDVPASQTTDPTDGESTKLEAARLLAELEVQMGFLAGEADVARRAELCRRIIYLDPAAAEAYYWLALSIDPGQRSRHRDEAHRRQVYQQMYDAASAYLQFPRNDRERVGYTFSTLQSRVMSGLIDLAADDPQQLTHYCEQALAVAEDCTRWYASVDWSDSRKAHYPTCLPASLHFDKWFAEQPARKARFYDWGIKQTRNTPGVTAYHTGYLFLRAAIAWDAAGEPAKAAARFHEALVGAKPSRQYLRNFKGSFRGYISERTIQRYAAHLTPQQQDELRRAIASTAYQPPPMEAMYGGFFGDGKSMWNLAHEADRFLIADMPAADLQPEAVDLPQGLIATLHITRVPSGVWFVGLGPNPDTGELTWLDLYHWPDERKPIRKIVIPQAWRSPDYNNTPGAGPLRTSNIVQAGDEIIWCPWLTAGPRNRPLGNIYTYHLKNETFAAYGVADGLPHEWLLYAKPSADGRSAVLATRKGLGSRNAKLAIYRNGSFFLADLPGAAIGDDLLPTEDGIFTFDTGESVVRYGSRNGQAMQPIADDRSIQHRIGIPAYLQMGHAGLSAKLNLIARSGDRVYMVIERGLLVMTTAGKVEQFWHPTTFWRWQELGGFIEGNCPLPPITARQVIVDDAQPHKLWIISRDHQMFPMEVYFPKYGDFVTGERPDPKFAKDDGLFVTCFDTVTNSWSKPLRFNGRYVMVQPFGDHLYFTGDGRRRVPKSAWRADQRPQDGPPRVLTADTLHGQASAALFDGDFDRTRELLEQAIEQGIAVDETQKMLKALEKLESGDLR